MKHFFCEFRQVATLVGIVLSVAWGGHAQAVQCEKTEALGGAGGAAYRQVYHVVISDSASKSVRVVSYMSSSDRDSAFSKCRQLSEVHYCSKIGTNVVGVFGYGEHIQEFKSIDIYGHTLQNSFAQLFRSGWGEINECKKDLVNAIAETLR